MEKMQKNRRQAKLSSESFNFSTTTVGIGEEKFEIFLSYLADELLNAFG